MASAIVNFRSDEESAEQIVPEIPGEWRLRRAGSDRRPEAGELWDAHRDGDRMTDSRPGMPLPTLGGADVLCDIGAPFGWTASRRRVRQLQGKE